MVDAVQRILADSALSFNFRPEQLDVIEAVLLRHLQDGCEPILRERQRPDGEGILRRGNAAAGVCGIFNIYTSAYCPQGGSQRAGGWAAVFENGASLSGGLLDGADPITMSVIATASALRTITEDNANRAETRAPIVRIHSDHQQFISVATGASDGGQIDLWADLRSALSGFDAQFVEVNMRALSRNPAANDAWALAHDAGRRFLKMARLAA